ncbi:hypothetical protein PoB_003560900 [Plakobranchus ocellatus]|uniref:Uncharacterized protein n=1 Tax=Plakobranchus ocellatus TaxID=259542 RepID=A0AAV4ASL5_9GAST|nr:hypothetical protein PoB_003560900 [Plakobranchus ocellatus]
MNQTWVSLPQPSISVIPPSRLRIWVTAIQGWKNAFEVSIGARNASPNVLCEGCNRNFWRPFLPHAFRISRLAFRLTPYVRPA